MEAMNSQNKTRRPPAENPIRNFLHSFQNSFQKKTIKGVIQMRSSIFLKIVAIILNLCFLTYGVPLPAYAEDQQVAATPTGTYAPVQTPEQYEQSQQQAQPDWVSSESAPSQSLGYESPLSAATPDEEEETYYGSDDAAAGEESYGMGSTEEGYYGTSQEDSALTQEETGDVTDASESFGMIPESPVQGEDPAGDFYTYETGDLEELLLEDYYSEDDITYGLYADEEASLNLLAMDPEAILELMVQIQEEGLEAWEQSFPETEEVDTTVPADETEQFGETIQTVQDEETVPETVLDDAGVSQGAEEIAPEPQSNEGTGVDDSVDAQAGDSEQDTVAPEAEAGGEEIVTAAGVPVFTATLGDVVFAVSSSGLSISSKDGKQEFSSSFETAAELIPSKFGDPITDVPNLELWAGPLEGATFHSSSCHCKICELVKIDTTPGQMIWGSEASDRWKGENQITLVHDATHCVDLIERQA
ncbi:MAG TPA: hypothetical protein PKL97_08765, partial [Candidatus Omnitrophota bacterium]|nr:hypothetical protein [Candidatus Omnitrophota bacterium]